MRPPLRIVSLLLSPLHRDARVIKQATALAEAGHAVTVIAPQPVPESAPFDIVTLPPLPGPALQRLALVAGQAPATILPALAPLLYWLVPRRRSLLGHALALKPDVVIANDVLTLPVGRALKARLGCRLIYDSHEFAASEHEHNWKWRLVSQRFIQRIEGASIAHADGVMTVSDRLAGALASAYSLRTSPAVVRNVPPRVEIASTRRAGPRTILFHGVIRHERGLEAVIASMPQWSFEGRLVIRGYGNPAYLDQLKAQAAALGVADRVKFEPALAPDALIRSAGEADIGVLLLPAGAPQYEVALPNKLFEYLMAGLAILAVPRAEIKAMLDPLGASVFAEDDAASVAAALNGIDEGQLRAMQDAARAAATQLNWEAERERLVSFVERIAGGAS